MATFACFAFVVTLAGCTEPEMRDPGPLPALDVQVSKANELSAQRDKIEAFWLRPTKASVPPAYPDALVGVGGLKLAYRYFRQTEPGPAVVISSGRTEHMGKYREVAYDLWRNGYSVYIHDHRGQGESERLLERDDVRNDALQRMLAFFKKP